MSVNLASEATNFPSDDDLRAALRPFRADAAEFEAAVRDRVAPPDGEQRNDSLVRLPPLAKAAAACLPLGLITGGKASAAAASAGGGYKLLSIAAFPAAALFALFAAAIAAGGGVHRVRMDAGKQLDGQAQHDALTAWWRRHRWTTSAVALVTLALAMIGYTSILFILYIASFAVLVYFLASLAKVGLADRQVIARQCAACLGLMGQLAAFTGLGDQEIHFVDPILLTAVFFGGAAVLFVVGVGVWRTVVFSLFLIPVLVIFLRPIVYFPTPARIVAYVESFHEPPFQAPSWQRWEIAASWAIESKRDPNLGRARNLLAQVLAGAQNPYILGSAFRVGIVEADQVAQIRDYDKRRKSLIEIPRYGEFVQPISSVEWNDWVIRAAVLRDDLTDEERNYLEKQLLATMDELSTSPTRTLEPTLRITQLLDAIDRPIDRDRYRALVHKLLMEFHSKQGGGFQLAGGFKQYLNSRVGSAEQTAYAVELMRIYGVPKELDLNWVRSFVRPRVLLGLNNKWITAVTRDRLQRLPRARPPTWFEVLYYERAFVAGIILVGLCIYATLLAPRSTVEPSARQGTT